MDKAKRIIDILINKFPDAKCELNHKTAYELLVAVVLSAQCTDVKVNKVTPRLFEKYPTAKELSLASVDEVVSMIKSLGLFKTKAKNLVAMAQKLENDYNGEVPSDRALLMSLAGVGQKTANVVLSEWFKKDALAVDTHVFRVSKRLALSNGKTAGEVEDDLTKIISKKHWRKAHIVLVLFGRYFCNARSPKCEMCELKEYCKYYMEQKDVFGQSKNKN